MQSLVRGAARPLAHCQKVRPLCTSAGRFQYDAPGQQRFNRFDGGRGGGGQGRVGSAAGTGVRRRANDNVNRIELVGHISQPPALKTGSTGREYAVFNLTTNRMYERGDGALMEEKEMHVCTSHKIGQVNYVMNSLDAGQKVFVLGSMRYENVPSVRDDVNSPMIRQATVFVDQVSVLAKSVGSSGGAREERSGGQRTNTFDDDEI